MKEQLSLLDVEKELSKNSLIKYIGGKCFWRHDIVRFFPKNTKLCVSPFVGGGHVEVLLSSMGKMVCCGDIYKPLVYAWNVLLKCPELIAERMEDYVPKRENHIEIRRQFFEAEDRDEDWREIGVLFYMAIKVSYNGILGKRTPTGSQQGESADRRMRPKKIAADVRAFHAPKMEVKLRGYKETLEHFPGFIAYMDPPYRIDCNVLYGGDGETHESFDHDEFADYLEWDNRPYIMSYNDSEWLRERYRHCDIVTLHGHYSTHGKTKKITELLIMNRIDKALIEEVKKDMKSRQFVGEGFTNEEIPDLL